MPIAVSGSNIVFADGSSIASGFTGFKNRIINGAMVIDQRNNGSSVTVTAGSPAIYAVDRTFINRTNGYSNNATAQRVEDAPAGFNYSLKYTVGTGETPTGSMYSNIQHFIEGFNIADLGWGSANAKTVTLSFWVKISITGTFGFNLRSTNAGWSYASTFTYSSANTWQFVSVTIPGPTSGGTAVFAIDNSIGVGIFWDLGVGSNLTTSTLNSWQAVNILGTTGTTKINATSGATYQITGIQFEVGSSATSFEYRDYGNELNLCLRYYHYIGGDTAYQSVNNVVWYTSGDAVGAFRHPVPMRTTPTIAKSGSWATLGGGGSVGQTVSADQNGPKTTQLGFSSGSGGSSGQASVLRVSNDLNFRLTFSAEL